jgi:phytoene dehydrogenase-like protein
MEQASAVVVGAGPNGLAAAIELARAGVRVTVHEAAAEPGGGARTAPLTLPGFMHDVCSSVHALGAVSPCWRALPLAEHGLEWARPDIALAHPFDDGTAALLHADLIECAAGLGSDAAAYARLLRPFVERADVLLTEVLAPPIHVPRHPWLLTRFAAAGLATAASTASGFSSDHARALFLGLAAHAPLALDRSPSAAFAIVLAVAAHAGGWPFARGGSGALSAALVATLRGLGGELVLGHRVGSLAELPPSSAVVLDLTPRQVVAVAGPSLPSRYRRRLARYRYGPGTFKLDWALAQPIPWRAADCARAGTVHLGGGAAEIAAAAAAPFAGRHAERPFVILGQPTRWDATRAPAGRHVAWAYCRVPHGSERDRTEAIEAQVERFAPGFRDVILARHAMDCRALEAHDANLAGGDLAAGEQDLAQLFGRPVLRIDPYATPRRGIFLCSAATPPGGGVHGMCGFHAARSVLRQLG